MSAAVREIGTPTGTNRSATGVSRTTAAAGDSVSILGVRVHRLTPEEVIDRLMDLTQGGGKHHVVTVNPEFVMVAQRNREFMDVLNRAALSLPDGVGILHASRLFGSPIKERIAGADTVERICAAAAGRGLSVYLLGAADGVAETTAEILSARYPGLRVAGTYSGSPAPAEEEDIRGRVNAASPDFLFVAYGAPGQDLWIARNLERLDVSVAMGVGGTFDFISGRAVRAPEWIRAAGLEWLHRLYREPSRWRRMLALPKFALRCVRHRVLPYPDR